MNDSIAEKFEFKPRPDGTVIIEFYDDRKRPINAQILSRNAFLMLPLGAFVASTKMDLTDEMGKNLGHILRAVEEVEDGLQ